MVSHFEQIDIDLIKLDFENPRIKVYLEMYGGNITDKGVALALNTSSETGTTFHSLKESIRVNKGLITPILVNHVGEDYIVIEGNTRVQIYRDFKQSQPNGPWDTIPAIIYDNLSDEEKHAIRLQAHLVGPRDWDAYSKAKYLYELSEVKFLPIETIISYCGGKKTEIYHLIDTYKTMQNHYVQMVQEQGYDMDFREFSKFAEAQKSPIQRALAYYGFDNQHFADWVIKGKIDNAQSVRQLPQVLKDDLAKKEFLKNGGKLSEAIKYVSKQSKSSIDLSGVPYEQLAQVLTEDLMNISYQEVKALTKSESDLYINKKNQLLTLFEELKNLIQDFPEE